ncbi:MAG: hypothetical protein JJV98_11905 [Desulfosarcina sp.]|nr:hypothetical protein [Desulfobacterales bacterium]
MKKKTGRTKGVVFECSDLHDARNLPIDDNMRKVLRQVDGHRSLASVAFVTGLSMAEMQETINALVDMELIVPVDP